MVSVAIDVGPLHGHRTGIGNAVAWLLEALEDRPELTLLPYLTSMRARPTPPQRRIPIPAAVALRAWSRWSWPAVDRWLGDPDVVHGTNYAVPPTRGVRLVSVYDCWFLEHPEQANRNVRLAGAVLTRAVADGATVVTSSHATAERVRTLLGTERVRVVHLGPPPALPTSTSSSASTGSTPSSALDARLAGRPYVLALGTVERRKNIRSLVDAFDRLAHELPDVLLVIAGSDGDATPQLQIARSRLDPAIDERILRAETVTDDLKHRLLAGAAALAYPSLDEGFGFPILEAQQAGVPVVASMAGSIPEVAGSGALLSPPTDVDALAANLHWVLTSDDMREKQIARGRSNVARFDWAATAAAYVDLYTELAESGP